MTIKPDVSVVQEDAVDHVDKIDQICTGVQEVADVGHYRPGGLAVRAEVIARHLDDVIFSQSKRVDQYRIQLPLIRQDPLLRLLQAGEHDLVDQGGFELFAQDFVAELHIRRRCAENKVHFRQHQLLGVYELLAIVPVASVSNNVEVVVFCQS